MKVKGVVRREHSTHADCRCAKGLVTLALLFALIAGQPGQPTLADDPFLYSPVDRPETVNCGVGSGPKGCANYPGHNGTDFLVTREPVYATADGEILGDDLWRCDRPDGDARNTSDNHRAGNWVWIDHGNGYFTGYFHLAPGTCLPPGRVRAGMQIAVSSNSGLTCGSSGPLGPDPEKKCPQLLPNVPQDEQEGVFRSGSAYHLHFEVRRGAPSRDGRDGLKPFYPFALEVVDPYGLALWVSGVPKRAIDNTISIPADKLQPGSTSANPPGQSSGQANVQVVPLQPYLSPPPKENIPPASPPRSAEKQPSPLVELGLKAGLAIAVVALAVLLGVSLKPALIAAAATGIGNTVWCAVVDAIGGRFDPRHLLGCAADGAYWGFILFALPALILPKVAPLVPPALVKIVSLEVTVVKTLNFVKKVLLPLQRPRPVYAPPPTVPRPAPSPPYTTPPTVPRPAPSPPYTTPPTVPRPAPSPPRVSATVQIGRAVGRVAGRVAGFAANAFRSAARLVSSAVRGTLGGRPAGRGASGRGRR